MQHYFLKSATKILNKVVKAINNINKNENYNLRNKFYYVGKKLILIAARKPANNIYA